MKNHSEAPAVVSAPDESRGHILLVEDDKVLRMLLRDTLRSEGFQITEAASRPDAMRLLASGADIPVAIVDLGLPPVEHTTIEGLTLIRDVHADGGKLKIIVLTGQDEEQAALEAIREGAFDFLSKPASRSDILNAVNRAFLFHRKERDLSEDGVARLQFNARYTDGLKAVREEAEEKLVRQVLRETGFNVYRSAEKLGVKRESIYYFMKKFRISRDDH
jgi:two-component system response regulator RegA